MPKAVAGELGSIPLAASGWHVYSNMEHLLEKRTVSGKGCPFDCSCFLAATGRPTTGRGMLPQTDALLARSMSIGIGVSDANLAPFGLRMRDDEPPRPADVADRFRAAAGKHLAG